MTSSASTVAEEGTPASGRPSGRRSRPRLDGAGLRADLRATLPDASAALVITGLIFLWLYIRVENGTSATIEVMPHMADASRYWMYWLCQAFGWSALLWAYITIVLGLLRSGSRPPWRWLSAARAEKLHRTTSISTIGLMFMHAFMLFLEFVRSNHADSSSWAGRVASAFAESFVPGYYPSGTGRIAILIGLLAFYLAIPLGLAYYLRHASGSRMWRAMHRFIIVVYVLSVWHTLLYGTNVWYDGAFRNVVWALQIPLAALLLLRLVKPARRSERLKLRGPRSAGPLLTGVGLAGRLAVVAVITGVAAVLVSGVDGGRTPGGAPVGTWPEPWVVWVGLLVLTLAVTAVALRLRPSRLRPSGRPRRGPAAADGSEKPEERAEPGEPAEAEEPAEPKEPAEAEEPAEPKEPVEPGWPEAGSAPEGPAGGGQRSRPAP